jgi:hypothetical protein
MTFIRLPWLLSRDLPALSQSYLNRALTSKINQLPAAVFS